MLRSLPIHPGEHQGGRMDAVPQPGRFRAVREYVAQVGIAPAAEHLRADRCGGAVGLPPEVSY